MVRNPNDELVQFYDELDEVISDEPERPTDNPKYPARYYKDDYYGTSDQELQ